MAFSALAVASACRPRKGTGFPGYALISNSGDHSLSAVDLTAFRLARTVPLTGSPKDILLAADGRSFVLTPENGTVHVVGPDLRVIKSRKLSDTVSAICLSPDTNTLIAIAPHTRELILAETDSLKVNAKYKLSAQPASLTIPPPPKPGEAEKPAFVAVSSGAQRIVDLVNYETGQRWSREFSGVVGTLRFRADGQRLLAGNLQEYCIMALTTPDLQTIADLPLAMAPQNLCFNADQGQLFVTGDGMDAVAIIFPYNPLEVEQTVLAGRDPGVMACSEEPAYLFVGSDTGPDVSILDIDTRRMIGIVDAGQTSTLIAVTPDSQYALILSESAGTMAVIHIPDVVNNVGNYDKRRNKSTASLFTLIPVGSRPVDLAIVPRRV
jgi:hypothetical protein